MMTYEQVMKEITTMMIIMMMIMTKMIRNITQEP